MRVLNFLHPTNQKSSNRDPNLDKTKQSWEMYEDEEIWRINVSDVLLLSNNCLGLLDNCIKLHTITSQDVINTYPDLIWTCAQVNAMGIIPIWSGWDWLGFHAFICYSSKCLWYWISLMGMEFFLHFQQCKVNLKPISYFGFNHNCTTKCFKIVMNDCFRLLRKLGIDR